MMVQTERVTFLASRDHKKALDAYAASNGRSVGHVVREATSQYIAAPQNRDAEEQELRLLLPEVEAAVASMREAIVAMRVDIAKACAAVDAALSGETAA